MALADEKYVAFTTFKRDGTAVTSPVWLVALSGDRYGFWTSSTSGKVKRLRNGGKVAVQPCNSRGKVTEGSSPTDGTAELVTSGAAFDEIGTKIAAKYGFMVKVTRFLSKVGAFVKRKPQPYADTGVVITLS